MFDFAPAAGKELQDGEYVEAERYGFETRGSPGMSVDGDGSGCTHDFGRFVIKDIHFDTSGNVERFSAFYEQHCEQPGAPALFGEISYGESPATTPELVQPSAVDWPRTPVGTSSVQVPVTVTAGASGAQVDSVSLAGTDPADFSIAGDTCVGTRLAPAETCQIALSTKPTQAGPRAAQLVLTDKSGATAIVALSVNPTPPPPPPASSNYVTMVSEPGDFMGGGMDTLFNWPEAVAVTGNGACGRRRSPTEGSRLLLRIRCAVGAGTGSRRIRRRRTGPHQRAPRDQRLRGRSRLRPDCRPVRRQRHPLRRLGEPPTFLGAL